MVFNTNPSKNFAYILGVLCSDGYMSESAITLTVKDFDFMSKFKKCMQKQFKIKGKYYYIELSNEKHSNCHSINFYSVELIRFLTKNIENTEIFHGNNWHYTIQQLYSWVLDDKYFYSFLSGFFDGDGSIKNPDTKYCLRFHIGYNKPAKFLMNILEKKGWKITEEYRSDRGDCKVIKQLVIYNFEQIRNISFKIKSSIKRKEERLIRFRNSKRIIPQYVKDIEYVFNTIKELRNKTGWGAKKISKHELLKDYNIHHSTIYRLMNKDKPPTLENLYSSSSNIKIII